MNEPRPWKRALGWLALLGPLFFATYGFANWFASHRAHVGVVVFDWERAIPFVPWTIIPYWSIDLLYAVSLLVCTKRGELDRHAQRLLLVQGISIFFFIATPLRFSFAHPPTDGIFGALFAALGSFDKPFNQAPSLHIALLVVIWERLAAHTAPRWRWPLHVWMLLIGISVLTTYQHHFIDVPTGLAAGFFAMWALPVEGEPPLRDAALARDPRRRRLAILYAAGALVCAAISTRGGAWLWLLWPCLSLVIVALNYAAIGARGFQKGSAGRLSMAARALLAPYLAAAWANSRLWTWTHPDPARVMDGVWIGRMPRAGEAREFAAIVDLSAELSCSVPAPAFYRSIGVLDLTMPDAQTLRAAAGAIHEGRHYGRVLVCCALGYSRSAAAVVTWLVATRRAATIDDAIRTVATARPSIVLRRDQFAAIESVA